ncbi:MAG: pyruvate dehydrogenase [Chloroflexi bacterium]|nr:pyruvate dehydrogenase [Chloroflexota bacterium]
MSSLGFAEAIDDAIAERMAIDPAILVFGEDVQLLRRNLYARFGAERVRNAPISEAAFLGAAVGAAMAGLRPVVEIMMADFLTVAVDALVNHAAKLSDFSGGSWGAPMVVRVACGGGYGDGGQHEQSLWGWLAHIPGIAVVVPSNPVDAAGLMRTALAHDGPVVFLEHKLLAENWLEALGRGGRSGLVFDVPPAGARAARPLPATSVVFGSASVVRSGDSLTLVSLGVGVHQALEAAEALAKQGISAGVIDLRSVSPLDRGCLVEHVGQTGRVVVVDEDYLRFGLSGEIAACLLEAGLRPHFTRVATEGTIPFARHLERSALPNPDSIMRACRQVLSR